MDEALIENIIQNIESTIENKTITPVNLLVVCLSAMQLAERTKLKGSDKKQLVLTVMEKLIDRYGGGDQSLLILLPGFIDSSIQLDRGDVVIRVDTQEVAGCCLGFLSKPKK